jgi:hypothetical protein
MSKLHKSGVAFRQWTIQLEIELMAPAAESVNSLLFGFEQFPLLTEKSESLRNVLDCDSAFESGQWKSVQEWESRGDPMSRGRSHSNNVLTI